MPELNITWPSGDQTTHSLDGRSIFTVGRATWNSVELPGTSISRDHARIIYRRGGYWVEDLGSQNGTLVNGESVIDPQLLVSGDRIGMGVYQLVFTGDEADTAIKLTNTAVAVARVAPSASPDSQVAIEPGSRESGLAAERFLFAKLDRVGQALIGPCPMGVIYQMIADLVAEILTADRVHLVLQDPQAEGLISKASSGPGAGSGETLMSQSIARKVLDERQAMLITDAQRDARFRDQGSVIKQFIQSAVCAPLRRDTEVLGLIYADRTLGRGDFSEVDLHLMTVIGHLAAVKIRESEAEEELELRRQLEEELRNAAKIQQLLLPDESIESEHLEIAGRFVPCHGVSGDFYDVLQDGTAITLMLGDVAGKGMAAALLMAGLHARIHAYVDASLPLADLVSRLNAYMIESVRGEKTATLFCARLIHGSGTLEYVNAGHNAPLLQRADGSVQELKTGGMLIGCLPEATYESRTIELQTGDVLVIFSDGVTEAETVAEEEFGTQRLQSLLSDQLESSPAEIVDRIVDSIQRFSEPRAPRDDLTALVAKLL